MKLCFSTLGCPEWNLKEVATYARQFGLDGVELRINETQGVMSSISKSQRQEIKKLFEANGLEIPCVSGYTLFTMPYKEQRLDNEKQLIENIFLADDLGANYIRTFLGDFPELPRDTVYDYMAESLNNVLNEAAGSTVKVVIETHHQLCTGEALKPLLDRVSSSSLGILWDVAHSFRAGELPQKTYEIFGNRVLHVHLKDEYLEGEKTIHCFPGQGSLPLGQCVEILLGDKYEGYCSFEWEKAWHPELPGLEVALPAYVDYIKNL